MKLTAYIAPGILRMGYYNLRYSDALAEELLAELASIYSVTVDQLKAPGRPQNIVYIRQLYFYFMRGIFKTSVSWQALGNTLGGRDHTTAMHSVKAFRDRLSTDSTTQDDYTLTQNKLMDIIQTHK